MNVQSFSRSDLRFFANLFLIVIAVFLSSCQDDDEETITAAKTDFDKTTLETKTYAIGDVVKADIRITPQKPLKRLIISYGKDSGGLAVEQDTVELNGAAQPFTYNLNFTIGEVYRGAYQINISIDAFVQDAEPNGWAGGPVTSFSLRLQ
jgi:hypothetical protein